MQQSAAAAGSESSPRSSKGGAAPVPKPSLTIAVSPRGLTGMAVSPDGTKVAATSKDGVLHIHNLNTGALVCGFKVWLAANNRFFCQDTTAVTLDSRTCMQGSLCAKRQAQWIASILSRQQAAVFRCFLPL